MPVAARSQTLRPSDLITFPGGFNGAIWVGKEKGCFARHGVVIRLTSTPNSVFQMTNVISGRFDMAVTAIDNVIAYAAGQKEAGLPPASDLVVDMGGDNGFLRLVTMPEVTSFAAGAAERSAGAPVDPASNGLCYC